MIENLLVTGVPEVSNTPKSSKPEMPPLPEGASKYFIY
jgi:hypothetical protein